MTATLTLVFAFLCAASVHAQKFHLVVRGTKPGQGLGATVAPAGDVDRDGKADFLVSAPATFGTGAGVPSIQVISGRNGKAIHVLTGYDLGGGISMDGGYDADKDGYPDFLVGDPSANANGLQSGRVVVYSGKTGKPIVTSKGPGAGRMFGRRARWVGDMNRDGAADFITDQNGGTSPWHQVAVCSGADGKILWSTSGIGSEFAAGAVGDLNKDGYPEVMMRVIQGGTLEYFEIYDGKDHKPRWRSTSGHSGADTCWPGDMNGDGVRDLIVLFSRELVAFSGKDGSLLFRLRDQGFGRTLAATGDVDGDGVADFAVAGLDHVSVYSGKLRQPIYRIPIAGIYPPFIGPVGDLDGDGALEFVVGLATESSFQDGGAAYVFSSKRVDFSWRTFGRDCPGGASTPRIVIPSVLPRIGKTFEITIDRLPGPTAGGLLLGVSNTSWSGGKLPFDLSVIGMGGCHLLVSPDIHVPFASTGTSVRMQFAIPFDYTYVGMSVFLQGHSVHKKANALGVATTGGLHGLFGL